MFINTLGLGHMKPVKIWQLDTLAYPVCKANASSRRVEDAKAPRIAIGLE